MKKILISILALIIFVFLVFSIGQVIRKNQNKKMDQDSVSSYKKITPTVEVTNFEYDRAIVLGKKHPWAWIFKGTIKNNSNQIAPFISNKLKLFTKKGDIIFKKNILRASDFNSNGYLYSNKITETIDKGEGFKEEIFIGNSALIDYRSLVSISPNSEVKFWFKKDIDQQLERAELQIEAKPYYENSPYYKQKYLQVKNATTERVPNLEKKDTGERRGKGYNLKGKIYNDYNFSLKNPYVFARIFFKFPKRDKLVTFPRTCGYKIADKINSKESINFDFEKKLVKEGKRCFSGFQIRHRIGSEYGKISPKIEKVEIFAWGWEK